MANLHNVVIPRPRLQWGNILNLLILLVSQVLAVVILLSVPFMAQDWLDVYQEFSTRSVWNYLYIPNILGFVFLVSGIWVISQRKYDSIGQVYSFFATTTAIGLFSLFDAYTSQRLVTIWIVATALSGGALINLALIYPEQARVNLQYPSLRFMGFFPSGILILLVLFLQVNSGYYSSFATVLLLEVIFVGLSLAFFIGSTLVRRIGSPSPMVREQARLIIWGTGIAFGPFAIWVVMFLVRGYSQMSPMVLFSTAAFPVCIAYTILRYRLLGADSLLKRSIVYGALLIFVAGSYALLVSGLSLVIGNFFDLGNPILVGVIVFLIALLIYPLRTSLQEKVDTAFFRGRKMYQEDLQTFSRELTLMTDIDSILHTLKGFIESSLSPAKLYIYTIDDSNSYYIAAPHEDGSISSEIRFAKSGALVNMLITRAGTIFLGNGNKLPEELQVDQARLAVLGAELFVPIRGQSGMVGWLALGARQSGEPYSAHDVDYLESLCDQASLAFERSQGVTALERRIHEMDTINKVAKGINQKSAFDELLNMFYTETKNLVPTVDFRITLRAEPGENFHHAFYIADNKRIVSRETHLYQADQSLEAEVVRGQFSIVTVDYVSECRRRGIKPESDKIQAWMSVPLNAGSEAIGAVSLGSREPSIIYTPEQVNLLQAIADLVAGAIVKARLLEESQRQARQMATLNELTRSLTSTLDLDPLLHRIMNSAVEIINCEAGSLLLVDEQTGELVFEVANGPVGSDLKGTRLPAGVGLVGKAVKTKQAIIENHVQTSEDWFNTDEKTGFSTKDLLVAPLIVKDNVIGVLEVLNKVDHSPFSQKDLELLTSFAGQVAVAIENARLYTQTDQALAARVDELSIMQSIDRELNASLDINKVMSMTLNTAIRHSKADAGLIGSIDEGELCVIAFEGYPHDDLSGEEFYRNVKLPGLQEVLNSNDVQSITIPPDDPNDTSPGLRQLDERESITEEGLGWRLLSTAQNRILIPIQREGKVIGIIFLERNSNVGFANDKIAFLSRLSDHAAIAISNAKLYDEVQAANRAKSEFVSSAAHELKNPLTSIKGYSDLLVGGAVGPVSEKQAGFLTTIRSNAERMGTLVSDLQDISRIEAGQLLLKFSKESLEDIINEVVSSLKKQVDEKRQHLVINLPENLPLIWCDKIRIIQVLTNLVSNAHKYTPAEGRIEIRSESVQDQGDGEGVNQLICVTVKDSGIGISQEDQKKLFQQFFRSEDKRVRETTGTGLGLSITKKLVEMQGGKLWFDSQLGQGSTFHFTIPTLDEK
jgi:signal transduction histidine kinase